MVENKCNFCEKTYQKKYKDMSNICFLKQKYCSRACLYAAWSKRRVDRMRTVIAICKYCNKNIPWGEYDRYSVKSHLKREFCSVACRTASKRHKKQEENLDRLLRLAAPNYIPAHLKIKYLSMADMIIKQRAEMIGWWDEDRNYARSTYSASIRDLSADD